MVSMATVAALAVAFLARAAATRQITGHTPADWPLLALLLLLPVGLWASPDLAMTLPRSYALIAAAALFAAGMKSIGLTGALVDAMKGSQSVAMIAAAVGPFLMAVVSGSGNAAALARNGYIPRQIGKKKEGRSPLVVDWPPRGYSWRSASMGSSRAARRAGM